jgi:hypothetical protein
MKNTQFAEALAARGDRFSQLMSKLVRDEYVGDQLHSRSGLSEEEHAELRSLSTDAHASFCQEMVETTSRLRALLSQGNPLYTLSIIQASNMVTGGGAYYEPTHYGLESKVELVAGLLLTQLPPAEIEPMSAKAMQSIHDELDRLLELSLLRNLTAPGNENIAVAELRIMSTVNWMTTRGTSYAHHGTDLATTLYRPFERWCLERYGFTLDDVLSIGETAHALLTGRMNALLDEARAFAERVQTHASSLAARENLTAEESAKLAAPETMVSLTQRAVIDVYEHGVRDAMSFTFDDLIDAGLPQDRVDAALKELSLSAGSLSPDAYGGLFDESPLVEHPFVEFDGRFVLVVPGMVLRDAVALLEDRFLRGVSTFSKARAKTLDRLAVGYLKALLPGSKGFTNLHYDGTELDGLVIFENTAFVVEGKGSALSIQAQRGDVVRLGRDLGRAVEDAWTQGARARDYLLRDETALRFTSRRRPPYGRQLDHRFRRLLRRSGGRRPQTTQAPKVPRGTHHRLRGANGTRATARMARRRWRLPRPVPPRARIRCSRGKTHMEARKRVQSTGHHGLWAGSPDRRSSWSPLGRSDRRDRAAGERNHVPHLPPWLESEARRDRMGQVRKANHLRALRLRGGSLPSSRASRNGQRRRAFGTLTALIGQAGPLCCIGHAARHGVCHQRSGLRCDRQARHRGNRTVPRRSARGQAYRRGRVRTPNTEGPAFSRSRTFRVIRYDVLGCDDRNDLALLRLRKNPFKMPTNELQSSEEAVGGLRLGVASLRISRPRDGTPIVMPGYPLGEPALVSTTGTIASGWSVDLRETFVPDGKGGYEPPNVADRYLADLQANGGNSGGAVFDMIDCAVVGVLVATRLTPIHGSGGLQASADLAVLIPSRYVAEPADTHGVAWSHAE